jgi:hypothetical protein
VQAEIAARNASNARARLRSAGFLVTKTLAEFNAGLSSVPQGTFDYLASREWIERRRTSVWWALRARARARPSSPPGNAAVAHGMRVRYFAAADLVEALYGAADNSVAHIIDSLLWAHPVICDELGFAPLDLTGTQRCRRRAKGSRRRYFRHHGPGSSWNKRAPVRSDHEHRRQKGRAVSAPRQVIIHVASTPLNGSSC